MTTPDTALGLLGHRGRVTTVGVVGSGDTRVAEWQASCACGWTTKTHTRDTNARRALRRHQETVLAARAGASPDMR